MLLVKKRTPEAEALGRSQGGFSTKIHLRSDGKGKPVTFLLTPGQQHELTVAEQLLEQGAIRKGPRGRIRLRPKRIAADKGYSSRRYRQYVRRKGMRLTIPRKKNEHRGGCFDRALYRQRNWVERLINRLKQFRRIATRYEKRADSYAAMLTIAMLLIWLK
jgi:transposase